jgi:hypothetical protein
LISQSCKTDGPLSHPCPTPPRQVRHVGPIVGTRMALQQEMKLSLLITKSARIHFDFRISLNLLISADECVDWGQNWINHARGENTCQKDWEANHPIAPLPPATSATNRKICLPKRPDGKYDYAKALRLWREAKKGRAPE